MKLTAGTKRIAVLASVLLGAASYQAISGTDPPPRPFKNCAAARTAGPTPIFRDHPRWGDHLDADGDGRACEPYRGQ